MSGNTIYESKITKRFQGVLKSGKIFHCWRLSQVEFTPTRKKLLIRAYSIFNLKHLLVLKKCSLSSMCWCHMQLDIRPIILMKEVSLNCLESILKHVQQSTVVTHISERLEKHHKCIPFHILLQWGTDLWEWFFFKLNYKMKALMLLLKVLLLLSLFLPAYTSKGIAKRLSLVDVITKSVSKFYHSDFLVIFYLADQAGAMISQKVNTCLLYTSDAADE